MYSHSQANQRWTRLKQNQLHVCLFTSKIQRNHNPKHLVKGQIITISMLIYISGSFDSVPWECASFPYYRGCTESLLSSVPFRLMLHLRRCLAGSGGVPFRQGSPFSQFLRRRADHLVDQMRQPSRWRCRAQMSDVARQFEVEGRVIGRGCFAHGLVSIVSSFLAPD